MQVPDHGFCVNDVFPVKRDFHAKHPMGGGVMRTDIDGNRFGRQRHELTPMRPSVR